LWSEKFKESFGLLCYSLIELTKIVLRAPPRRRVFHNPEKAFGGSQRMMELIDLIYGAVGKAELWDVAVREIAAATGSDSIGFFAGSPDATRPALLSMTGIDPAVWQAFSEYYAAINPIMSRCEAVLSPEQVWRGELVITDAELANTEFYNDFFKPNGMHFTMGLRLLVDNGPSASFSCQRPLEWGPFSEAAETVVMTLKPHLQRALELHHRMGAMETAKLGLEAALDAHEHAVFGIGPNGQVMPLNRGAEAVVQEGDCLRLSNGRLSAAFAGKNRKLQQLLSDAIGMGFGPEHSSAMLLERTSGKRALRLTATRFVSAISGSSMALAALMFVSDPGTVPQSRGTLMRMLYGLTPAEVRVADLLLRGLDAGEAANQLGLTLGTVRLQTKRVMAKTGTRRQAELMKLGLSLPVVKLG
jgi:DNA-binding CsgD family transcriptional regulator